MNEIPTPIEASETKIDESYYIEPVVIINERLESGDGVVNWREFELAHQECNLRIDRDHKDEVFNDLYRDKLVQILNGAIGITVERALKALERARFNKYDTLNGLQNYEHVKDSYIAMLSRMRDDQIVIFGIIDVNDLKIINDHFGGGHDAGDQAIACVAEALKSAASSFENSFVARMSRGDEFGIFVVCDQPGMKDAKDDIVARLHEASFTARVPASDQVYEQDVSVSIGFAVADKEHAINFNLLKSEADAKMYEEKRKLKEGQDA